MDSSFESTSPRVSRWDQNGSEYVASNAQWCERFAVRLASLRPELSLDEASHIAAEISLDDTVRALSPELAVEDLLALDLPFE